MQLKMFNEFCAENEGIHDGDSDVSWYRLHEIFDYKDKSKIEIFNREMKPFESIWNDFVSFRVNLFETQLKSLFYNDLKCSVKDIKYFYSFFKCYRNSFVLLPTQAPRYIPLYHDSAGYYKIVSYFSSNSNNNNNNNINNDSGSKEINNIDPILVYYFIWNCIYCIMHKHDSKNDNDYTLDKYYGFDCKIGFSDPKPKARSESQSKPNTTKNKFCTDSNKIRKLLSQHIIDEFAQTNVFGNYFVREYKESDRKKSEKQHKDCIGKCKEYLFNNNLTHFNKLLKYSIEDVLNVSDHINDYNILTWDNKCDTGLSNLISNRLCYAIYHDLAMYSLNFQNKMMFPQLLTMYKFIFNFSIYMHCYPSFGDSDSMNEEYCLTQYFDYRNKLFKLKFGKLRMFNYFEYAESFGSDGTLLHSATCCGYRQMCHLLIKDGFDCQQVGRHQGYQQTPMSLAQIQKDLFLIPLFEQQVNAKETELKESDEKEMQQISNMDNIQDASDLVIEQTMFAKYFLKVGGLKVTNTIENVGHKQLVVSPNTYGSKVLPYFSDEFYFGFDSFAGLTLGDNQKNNNDKNMINVMNTVLDCVIYLLDTKMVLSDDLLMICFEYCSTMITENYDNGKLMEKFVNALLNCVSECLTDDKDLKSVRNYYYFKEYLLFSNVWYCKYNNNTLYTKLSEIVQKALLKQKKYIWESVKKEQNGNRKIWKRICNFNISQNTNDRSQLRQDKIENGIVSPKSEKELYLVNSRMDDPEYNTEKENYSVFSTQNSHVYLTECLTFAHSNNGYFQHEMTRVFYGNPYLYDENEKKHKYSKCKYCKAPVKTYNRCLIKSSTDYSNVVYPNAACILDYLRGSITFNDGKSLLNALNTFVNSINNNEIPFLLSIKRVKNGFKNISKWKSYNDSEYCDIKFNIVYQSPFGNKQCMLVEVQFLLNSFLEAKKMGHKFYNIERRYDLINCVNNIININYNNYENYKNKIIEMIQDKNINQFSKQLLLKPNIVLSYMTTYSEYGDVDYTVPLFYKIGCSNNRKFIELFLDCLFHYNDRILKQQYINGKNKNEKFWLKKYFDCEQSNRRMVEKDDAFVECIYFVLC